MADATLVVKIVTDATQAQAGASAASGRFAKMGGTMRKLAVPAAAVIAGAVAVGKAFADSASRTQQAMGGVDAVFGRNAGKVKSWAADAASSIGLAKSEYGELATIIGSQLKNAGLPLDQVTDKTKGLISTGADLAAMYGGTTKEAVEALSSALKGESDPIEKYGATVNAAAISAEMAAQGWDKLTGSAAKQAKAQATLNVIQQQTTDAHGAAAREADTAAAKQQQLAATFENMKSSLGTALLPVIAKFAGILAVLAGWMAKNKTAVQILAVVLVVLSVAVLAVNAALWVMAANPVALVIGAIVLAVAALAIGFVVLYKRSSTFRKVVGVVFGQVKAKVQETARVLAQVFRVAFAVVSGAARGFMAVVRGVMNVIRAVIGWVSAAVRTLQAWFNRLRVPTSVRTALGHIRDAAGWVIDKLQSLKSWLGKLSLPGAVRSALDGLKNAVDRVIGAVKSLVSWIGRIHVPRISLPHIPGTRSASASAAGLSTVPRVAGAGAPAVPMGRAAGVGGVTINVNGALDPESVARQLGRILGAHERRTGRRGLRVA